MTAGSFDLARIIATQRELFYRLDEFFQRATGEAATDFSSPGNFSVEIRRKAQTIAARAPDAFIYAQNELRQFYEKQSASTPTDIGSMVAGHKLLLGGSTRLLGSHIDAVRGALFWTDTVFIRDPVLPWLETDRRDERFARTLMLQAAHGLLHLREFADADASCPPIIIYPAWEKIREDQDKDVQKDIESFMSRFLSKHLGVPLNSLDEAIVFAKTNRSEFFEVVQKQGLYIPPGGSVGMTVDAALEHWRAEAATWRTQEHMDQILSLPMEGQLFLALAERLRPQFHTTSNAIALGAQPLFCIEQQAHYFKPASVRSSRCDSGNPLT